MTIHAYLPSLIPPPASTVADKIKILESKLEKRDHEGSDMSYNHHTRTQGYTPSYTSQNTGAAYMARRGWDRDSEENTISFYGKRSTKRIYIGLFVLLALLLIAAIVVIILFATGVFSSSSEPLPNPTFQPIIFPPVTNAPVNPVPTLPPPPLPPQPIFIQNATFTCTLLVKRQANAAYDIKTSSNYLAAFRIVGNAVNFGLRRSMGEREMLLQLNNVIAQSTLQPYGAGVILDDLRNRGNDLEVVFRIQVPASSGIDQTAVANVLRADNYKLEGQLGGNAVVDANSISVVRSS